jgi:hypothetical protein
MTNPHSQALARHRRHHVLDRSHHGFEPAGDLVIGGFKAPDPAALGVQIGEKLVTLFGKKTNLLFQSCKRTLAVALGKNLLQMTLKLINRRVEPLQSICLVHCVRPSPLRRRQFIPLGCLAI